jgi:hypothetical protein
MEEEGEDVVTLPITYLNQEGNRYQSMRSLGSLCHVSVEVGVEAHDL